MSSYMISVAEGPGSYRHIRISSDATLLDLHEAITDAYKLGKGGSPYFRPQMPAKGGQPIKYRINNSKTAVAMRQVKLKDAGFASKKTLIYFPAETPITLNCRTLRVLDEETPQPQVVRASGSAFDFKLGFQRALKALEAHAPMQSIREAEGKALGLPEKTQRKLAAYALAASNLHGLVPIETSYQFYISGRLPPDLLAFKMFCVIFSDRADTRFYILDKQGKVLKNGQQERSRAHYIAEYTVVEGKAFSYVRARQEGKPYYLPPEEDFLRWADEDYMEKNEHFFRLRSHLMTLGLDAEKAKVCMSDILTCIRFDSTHPQEFFDLLEQYKIILRDLKAVNFALN
ncbi:MAG: hypothetical protein GX858_04965, partial [Clostridiales bacterium]|nr:hypothetical protein [Clostridiales bacterium]